MDNKKNIGRQVQNAALLFKKIGYALVVIASAVSALGVIGSAVSLFKIGLPGNGLTSLLGLVGVAIGLAVGLFMVYLGSLFTVAFGRMVENSDILVECMNGEDKRQEDKGTLNSVISAFKEDLNLEEVKANAAELKDRAQVAKDKAAEAYAKNKEEREKAAAEKAAAQQEAEDVAESAGA